MRPTRVYIAASLNAKTQAAELRTLLINSGYIVTSNWILVETGYDREHEELMNMAEMDFRGVIDCDVFIHAFTEIKSSGGGADTELGIALALRKEVFIIGPPKNIFHYVSEVTYAQNMAECSGLVGDYRLRQQRTWREG